MASCAAMLDRRSPSPRFDYFFPRLPFLHPLFLLPHEYIKVHAFLPNITCVHEQTDPSLSLLAVSPHFLGTASCALRAGNGNPPGFSPSVFSFPLSLSLLSSLFIFSSCPFQLYIYIHTYIHTYFYVLTEGNLNFVSHARKEPHTRSINFVVYNVDRLYNAINP